MKHSYHRLIVIEGPDGAGKSTLAEAILEALPEVGMTGTILHNGPPEGDGSGHIAGMLDDAMKAFQDYNIVIMDRSPLSEQIYGPILRGKVVGDQSEWEYWDAVQQGLFPNFDVQLLIDADDELLRKRAYDDRGEDFVPPEYFTDIIKAYRFQHEVLASKGWTLLQAT